MDHASPSLPLFDLDSGALFSTCDNYRYRLWRRWDAGPTILWLMLNPSTADECSNDPTVERCQRRSIQYGYGEIRVCNIFALRSTNPQALYEHVDPIGPDNNAHIIAEARAADAIVCGWGGTHGDLHDRGHHVLRMLQDHAIEALQLRVTRNGHPGHPLYVGYNVRPTPIPAIDTTGERP